MFCVFCDQTTNGLWSTEVRDIQAYGQKSDIKETVYYCDSACAYASIRNKKEPQIRALLADTEELVADIKLIKLKWEKKSLKTFGKVIDTKESIKEGSVFVIVMHSLSKFLKACLERKPRKELKQLQDEAKRLFHEGFVYETYLDTLSRWNACYLKEQLLDVWSK